MAARVAQTVVRWAALATLVMCGCATTHPVRGPGSSATPDSNSSNASKKHDAPIVAPKFDAGARERIAAVQHWVARSAREHRLDRSLINGVIWVESRFVPRAKSPAGARGLMQLMPATAAALAQQMGRARANPYDPAFNIAAGSLYLAGLLRRYDGDIRLALAAYNGGAGNVAKWLAQGGLPDHSERYVQMVLAARSSFGGAKPPPEVRPRRPEETLMAEAARPQRNAAPDETQAEPVAEVTEPRPRRRRSPPPSPLPPPHAADRDGAPRPPEPPPTNVGAGVLPSVLE